MARATFSDPYQMAELRPVSVDGRVAKRQAVVLADDDGQPHDLAFMGMDYNLVQNSLCRDVMSDVMSRSEHDWKILKQHWDGRRFVSMHVTTSEITVIENGTAYPIHLGMSILNSYNGSTRFGFELFLFNLLCANQYFSRNRFGYFAMRHTNQAADQFDLDDALANMGRGVEHLLQYGPRLKALMGTPAGLNDLVAARKAINMPDKYWSQVLGRIEEPTQWGLFQSMTNVASHDVGGFRSLSVSDAIGDYFIGMANRLNGVEDDAPPVARPVEVEVLDVTPEPVHEPEVL